LPTQAGTQQLVALAPQGSIANQLGEFIVEAEKSLFQLPISSSLEAIPIAATQGSSREPCSA
jgi:hypothetical protein